MARVLVGMGVTKVRLTGGEPLLRNGVVEFVRELAKLRPQGLKPSLFGGTERGAKAPLFHGTDEGSPLRDPAQVQSFGAQGLKPSPVGGAERGAEAPLFHGAADAASDAAEGTMGHAQAQAASLGGSHHAVPSRNFSDPLDIALTTNGHLLADLAQPLKDAGLIRVTVSMDAVDPDRFARITRVPNGYDHVLAGIRAARRAGLWPLKVNCVLMRGFNEDQIIPFGMFAREEGVTVRFIEFMPLEEGRTWEPSTVVTLDEILARMADYRPLVEIPHGRSETARRYRFEDGVGEIGIIAPVSHPFCGHCSRIRITSDGKIRTCLFSVWDHDLHAQMRRGATDEELEEFIRGVVAKKEERHHIGEPDFVPASRTMVHIGG